MTHTTMHPSNFADRLLTELLHLARRDDALFTFLSSLPPQPSTAQSSATENVVTLRGSTDVVAEFFFDSVNRQVKREKF